MPRKREQYPPIDFELRALSGDEETWEQSQQYETAYQLARIAGALENIAENLHMAGRGS